MLFGAVAVLLTGEISINGAVSSINIEVMVFLFSMFIIGEAVSVSGFLAKISCRICQISKTRDQLLIIFVGSMAVASAVLMNDTVAIIGTPLALSLARRYHIPPVAMILTLCFALTTGSVPSPLGNPQNLLISTYWNPPDPFLAFASGLLIPTLISLGLIILIMRHRFRHDETGIYQYEDFPLSSDPQLSCATGLSLIILGFMILIRIIGTPFGDISRFPLGIIALTATLPILVLARQRITLIRNVDWRTLVFFAAMFILMQSVYDSGWFQSSIPFSQFNTVPLILALSVVLSQFISNVPFIALFQPIIVSSGLSTGSMLSLVAGSTIAGNLTILGAASNVIVIQQAEKAGVHLTFRDFLMIGLPLTFLQSIVYAVWLAFF